MNRYTAAGLIRDAMDGMTAIVLTPHLGGEVITV